RRAGTALVWSQTPPVTTHPTPLQVTRVPLGRRASGFVLVALCRETVTGGVPQLFVKTTRPVNVDGQSVPVKSASMRVACASPTLPNVPRQPRGESNSPCVLIRVGGELPGDSAVVPVVCIVSH